MCLPFKPFELQIFMKEKVTNRANGIATRLKDNFPIDSDEWQRWTNKTETYHATSLTQVFGEYFKEHSIGDIGGNNANYIPKAGFVGTLAPGELFTDSYPLEDLPKKILHPWPAMQEIPYHVRWPPSHPMIPPVVLWVGLLDKYTQNFTASVLEEAAQRREAGLEPEVNLGGVFMEPKHAVRIAKFGTIGSCYEPSEQIPHGGMMFNTDIPGYNPDHGPTVPPEEVDPPIPKELLPITEVWLDPLYGMEISPFKLELEEAHQAEVTTEEEQRRNALEKLLRAGKGKKQTDQKLQWELQAEMEEAEIDREVDAELERLRKAGAAASGFHEDYSTAAAAVAAVSRGGEPDPDAAVGTIVHVLNENLGGGTWAGTEEITMNTILQDLDRKRPALRKEIVRARSLVDVAAGQ